MELVALNLCKRLGKLSRLVGRDSVMFFHQSGDSTSSSTGGVRENWKDQLEKSMNLWVVSYGLEWNKKQIKKAKIYYRDKSPEFLRDAVINFISAGLDTTSSAFCWFFWLLSLNQEVERNILKELETIREQKGKNIGDGCSLADVRVMNFRGTAILQDGTFVGEGWIVMYQTPWRGWRIHGARIATSLFPKGGSTMGNEGKRVHLDFQYFMPGQECVFGKDMACVHMKLIAASVIERFKIQLQKKEKHPVHSLSLTLKIEGGLQEIVKERDAWT